MSSTYSVTQAQSQLPSLIKKAEKGQAVGIRRRNETVAFLLSRERMEAIVETLEVLSNPEAVKLIAAHRSGQMRLVSSSVLADDEQ